MYIGRTGVIRAARQPVRVCVISSGTIRSKIKENRPIAALDVMIGSYAIRGALALFDTGASESVLCLPGGRGKIGSEPYDTSYIKGIDGEMKDVYYYDASLIFPGGVSIDVGLIDVYEGDFDMADIIIGMDIISKGKLVIDGKAGTFSFEI